MGTCVLKCMESRELLHDSKHDAPNVSWNFVCTAWTVGFVDFRVIRHQQTITGQQHASSSFTSNRVLIGVK